MLELVERLLTIDETLFSLEEYSNKFNEDFEPLWSNNALFKPVENTMFITYMFLGSFLTFSLADVMQAYSMRDILVKYDYPVIHVCSRLHNRVRGRIVFRTIDLENSFQYERYSLDDITDIVLKLKLNYYPDMEEYEIDWYTVNSKSEGDKLKFDIRRAPAENLLFLQTSMKNRAMYVQLQEYEGSPVKPKVNAFKKIKDKIRSGIANSAIINLKHGDARNAVNSMSFLFKTIHHAYKQYFPALVMTVEAYNGFINGLFFLSLKNRHSLECSIQVSLKGKHVLKILPKQYNEDHMKLGVPIIVDSVVRRAEHIRSSAPYEFVTSSETDAKQALLISSNLGEDLNKDGSQFFITDINQGIVSKLFQWHTRFYQNINLQTLSVLLKNELQYTMSQLQGGTLSRYLLGQVLAVEPITSSQNFKKYIYLYSADHLNKLITTFLLSANSETWLALHILENPVDPQNNQHMQEFLDKTKTYPVDNHQRAKFLHVNIVVSSWVSCLSASKVDVQLHPTEQPQGMLHILNNIDADNAFELLNEDSELYFKNTLTNALFSLQTLFQNQYDFKMLLKGVFSKQVISYMENKDDVLTLMKPLPDEEQVHEPPSDAMEIESVSSLTSKWSVRSEHIYINHKFTLVKCGFSKKESEQESLLAKMSSELQVDYATGFTLAVKHKPDLVTLLFTPQFRLDYLIKANFERALDVRSAGLYNYQPNRLAASCLRIRDKRSSSSNDCLFTWSDIDQIRQKKDEGQRDMNKITIDSDKFMTFLTNTEPVKVSQIINFLNERKINFNDISDSDLKGNVLTTLNNQKVINSLQQMADVSGKITRGLIVKDMLADLLNGNYKAFEFNAAFILANHMLLKLSTLLQDKALKLKIHGNYLTSKVFQSVSPFIRRAAFAYNVYDLFQNVKAYKLGNNEALPGIVNDAAFITLDVAEVGIELAETFGAIEGVSSVFGPVGTAIGAIIFLGTEIYISVNQVERIDQIVHLTRAEKLIEGLRSLLGQKPEAHIQALIEQKQRNNALAASAISFLTKNPEFKNYILPTQIHTKNGWKNQPNNQILLIKTRYITMHRSLPDLPSNAELLCFTSLNTHSVSNVNENRSFLGEVSYIMVAFGFLANPFTLAESLQEEPVGVNSISYTCEHAMGVSLKNPPNSAKKALIELDDGQDFAIGFQSMPNIFLLSNGYKNVTGGEADDTFILTGNLTTGTLNGANGTNTVDFSSFSLNTETLNISLTDTVSTVAYNGRTFTMTNIQVVIGRPIAADNFSLCCDTEFIDVSALGGYTDTVYIPEYLCVMNTKIRFSGNAIVMNDALIGDFMYFITNRVDNVTVYLKKRKRTKHHFIFDMTIRNIRKIVYDGSVNNTFKFTFDNAGKRMLTINNMEENSVLYFSDGIQIYINETSLYGRHIENRVPSEIINTYTDVADRLGIMFIMFSNTTNSTVIITHSNRHLLKNSSFHSANVILNDPLHKTHMVSSTAENVFVLTTGKQKLININEAAIPEVTIHQQQTSLHAATLNLKGLMKQLNKDLKANLVVNIERSGTDKNDLHIVLSAEIEGENHPVSKVTVNDLLVNGAYKFFYIVKKAPMQIVYNQTYPGNPLSLIPVPLIFGPETTAVLLTEENVEENTQVIIKKLFGDYIVMKQEKSLILTNLKMDSTHLEREVITVILRNFYFEPILHTLLIKFNNDQYIQMSSAKFAEDMVESVNESLEGFKNIQMQNFRLRETFESLVEEINAGSDN